MHTDNCPYISGDNHAGLCAASVSSSSKQLNAYDYLAGTPGNLDACNLVEVQFKNTRKAFFVNDNHLSLAKGDIVAVEASPGHDIGIVSLTGSLVRRQIEKAGFKNPPELRRIYRKARPLDIDKWHESRALEQDTMIQAREMARDLGLQMKIGDVEYQGDGQKAIFYYIADGRVDFRQLIRVLADAFRVRIEMRQIGARQEAGRIGGFGPCGRELCCATWMTRFNSVSTTAARFQDIAPNPQKLAGQCAKLKCCINFEVDSYVEAGRKMPPRDAVLETKDAEFYFFKADILSGLVTYSTSRQGPENTVTISRERAFEVMALNRNGVRPDQLDPDANERQKEVSAFGDILGQDAITRFDRKKKKKRRNGERTEQPQNGTEPTTGDVEQRQPANEPPRHQPRDRQRRQPRPEDQKPSRRNDRPEPYQRRDNPVVPNPENVQHRPRRNDQQRRRDQQKSRIRSQQENRRGQNRNDHSEQGN